MTTDSSRILELEGICVGYERREVLHNVNFSVGTRDFVGMVGANGSGKTTLLRVILGLLTPWSGSIRFFREGRKVPRFPIGYMPQLSHVDPDFPIIARDVIHSGLIGLGRRPDRGPVRRVMERMGIAALARRPLGEMSGGQRQRVFLARAIVAAPPLLLLDEPDTYVDRDFGRDFYDILEELNREMAILLVSHDLGTIASQVKSIACVNGTLYHHESSEITQELMDSYRCPIDLITHGRIPHRVLKAHQGDLQSERNHERNS